MIPRIYTNFILVFCLVLILSPAVSIEAASSKLTEDQVKVAYIYNFAKFVQWPENAFTRPDAPLCICIIGSDSLLEAMESLKYKTVQGRPLKISGYSSNPATQECHILFIGQNTREESWDRRDKKIVTNVLTIGDFESFVSQGGIIEFITEGSKIRFAVNLKAAERAQLKLSSKLLKLAVFVKE